MSKKGPDAPFWLDHGGCSLSVFSEVDKIAAAVAAGVAVSCSR